MIVSWMRIRWVLNSMVIHNLILKQTMNATLSGPDEASKCIRQLDGGTLWGRPCCVLVPGFHRCVLPVLHHRVHCAYAEFQTSPGFSS